MLDVLIATPEHGVVHGGCELAHPTTDGVFDLSANDGACREVAVSGQTLAYEFVDAEFVPRHQDVAVDFVSHRLDVDHPIGAAWVKGGEG